MSRKEQDRIAVFHDHADCIGGGEKLAFTLARSLNADVITTDLSRDSVKKMGFDDVKVIDIGSTIKIPPLKQISASVKFASCDFSRDYGFFIMSGAWSIFAAKKHKPNLLYCHTPVRAFYDLYEDFMADRNIITRPVFSSYAALHSRQLQKALGHVSRIVTNSRNVQDRIRKYHCRDSDIIYPPIKQYRYRKNEDFWLSVNRLYPQKRIELQIEAFRKMPDQRLVIVGDHAEGDHADKYAGRIAKNLPDNIEVRKRISEKELEDLYADCIGLIATAQDEDFGMNVVEAMSAGKPVIATDEGGHRETMIDNITGKLINPGPGDLINAIKAVSRNPG
ncbi:glycosyltransferase, partial [Candidatus Woesearchaeota archaeon]|nr:glycosyltransferase [Candidatus Woesearchaeota archaeon]